MPEININFREGRMTPSLKVAIIGQSPFATEVYRAIR
jgi:hypothetical protein